MALDLDRAELTS